MGGQGLLLLIGLKILIIMTSLQNIVISGAQGLLMMGSKFLIKMIRLQNIKRKEQCLAAWSSLSKILIPSTSGDLELISVDQLYRFYIYHTRSHHYIVINSLGGRTHTHTCKHTHTQMSIQKQF